MKLMKLIESMRKKMSYFLFLGILLMATGAITIMFHPTPAVIPVAIVATGSALIGVYLSTRGGAIVYDEMIGRIDALSGAYTNIATLNLIFVLAIINFFHPLSMRISTLLLILMLYMSILYILLRTYLRRRGKAE
jgi:uncharacterized membrane protein